ncbi:MAG: methylated-DNA--[protein]-cysteine S-methyltransferase, partial [Alphaproteobacteria bacterium]
MSCTVYQKTIESPVGVLCLRATDKGLCEVVFPGSTAKTSHAVDSDDHPMLLQAEAQLTQYFLGTRKDFDLPLDMHGSVFQIKAWRALQSIPYGKTISYQKQAEAVGDKKKARAVGAANGR